MVLMRKFFGIVSGDDGRYHMASVSRRENNWRVASISTWERHNLLRRELLLSKGVSIGVPGIWRRNAAEGLPETRMQAASERQVVPCAETALVQESRNTFIYNSLAVVPDDAFLASLPLAFSTESHNNFLSLYATENYYLTGVIVDRKLVGSFKMAPADPQKLAGHLGRIERYWLIRHPNELFPSTIYILGAGAIDTQTLAPTRVIPLSVGALFDGSEVALRAIGVALTQTSGCVPQYAGPTTESALRTTRAWIAKAAAVLVIAGVACAMGMIGLNQWDARRARTYEQKYQQVFADNKEIRTLVNQTNLVAKKVTRIEATFAHQTVWGRLLDALGKDRPDGLFLERLGSQPTGKNDGRIQIAITGWVPREDLVTDFIATLQKMPFVMDIKLESMQRDKVQTAISEFRIVCTLILSVQ
jgi:Tfp pilus assembly protein PilN